MDLEKQIDFFNPNNYDKEEIHIIGVGAIGSHLVEMLARMGFEDMDIYDFDDVTDHNLTNQMFFDPQIDQKKLDAIQTTVSAINPDCKLRLHHNGWETGTRLSGHVFLAVDNIELRKAIVEENKNNLMLKSISDFRMGLDEAQHYFADMTKDKDKDKLLASMQFTHEEAKAAMPVSACGTALNVISTVRCITSLGIANWMHQLRENEHKTYISVNVYTADIISF